MSTTKQRHTLTLDPDAVRRADCLRKDRSLSAFVNDALIAYSLELEQALYQRMPPTAAERATAQAASASFVGDDDEDWDALFLTEQ